MRLYFEIPHETGDTIKIASETFRYFYYLVFIGFFNAGGIANNKMGRLVIEFDTTNEATVQFFKIKKILLYLSVKNRFTFITNFGIEQCDKEIHFRFIVNNESNKLLNRLEMIESLLNVKEARSKIKTYRNLLKELTNKINFSKKSTLIKEVLKNEMLY